MHQQTKENKKLRSKIEELFKEHRIYAGIINEENLQ